MKRGRVRRIILWVHLILGLPAALIIVVIGVTGTLLAFRDDYGRWTHPDFFDGKTDGAPMSQDALIAIANTAYAPSRVESINITFHGNYEYLFMNDRGPLIVNTIDGRILDPRAGQAWHSKLVIKANELHTKLAMGTPGRLVRDFVTFEVLLLIPTGIVLWWKTKRFGVKWKASWYKRFWDLHSTIGIVIALPILFLATTGSFIALRLEPSWQAGSEPPKKLSPPQSTMPADSAQRIAAPLDAAIAAANAQLPGLKTYKVMLPESPRSPITVEKSPAGWSTRNQRSAVFVDQYSGVVLRVDPARSYSSAYKVYDLVRREHTADRFGGKIILGVSSLLFALLSLTGIGLGVWKFSNWLRRSKGRLATATPAAPHAGKN